MKLVQFPLRINIKGELLDNKGDVIATPSEGFDTAFSQIQDQLELNPDNVFQTSDVFSFVKHYDTAEDMDCFGDLGDDDDDDDLDDI